jgi:ABC-2 type transport system ATP-binding protein
LLKCENLTKKYKNGKLALDSASLEVETKGVFALIGRNGAGKTTLVRILSTQLEPTSGRAEVDGIDVVANASELRKRIAVIPQEARPPPWATPKQLVFSYLLWRGFSFKEAGERAEKALAMLTLSKDKNKPSRFLSGGTKRRLMLAMVINCDAKILFLDEPTTGLDPISRRDIWKIIEKLKKKYFIFLTTHYLEEAENLADKIAIMENGKLLEIGGMDELRSKLKYQYCIKILDHTKVKVGKGEVVNSNGFEQIFTTQKEAYKLSEEFIKSGVKFSINPASLDDIFYYVVKKPVDESDEAEYQ